MSTPLSIDLSTVNDVNVLSQYLRYLEHPLTKFRPRPNNANQLEQQQAFYEEQFDGVAVVLAGTGSGKSYVASAKVAKFLGDTPPPEKMTPFWIVSRNLDITTKTVWAQNLAQFITPEYIQNVIWLNSAAGLPRTIILKPHANGNQWIIEFKSSEQGRAALQGANIGGFLIDEQIPWEVFIEVLARCRKWRLPGSRMMTLTPLEPFVELQDIYENQEKYPDFKFYRMNTRYNTAIDSNFVNLISRTVQQEMIETRLVGAFAVYEGLIYKEFTKESICEPFPLPKNWIVYRGIDLGWSHATACVWVAKSFEDTYYVFREYNKTQTHIGEHLKAFAEDYDDRLVKGPTFIDSANAQVVKEMQLNGLECRGANKEVMTGIGVVQSLLRNKKLYIFSTCTDLISQMRQYVWDSKKCDSPKKETPQYLCDCCDALRYVCNSLTEQELKWTPIGFPERGPRQTTKVLREGEVQMASY